MHGPGMAKKRSRRRRGKHKPKTKWARTAANLRKQLPVLDHTWTRVRNVQDRRKFSQVLHHCGWAAVNNAFGELVLPIQTVKDTITRLHEQEPGSVHGSDKGDASVLALQLACKLHGIGMTVHKDEHGQYPSHMNVNDIDSGRYVALGLHHDRGHWFAIDCDQRLIIDSATTGFLHLDQAGVLKACNGGISKLYRVYKN